MSIVIVGGNERMTCQYENICRSFGYKAKIFPKENGSMKKKMGTPDLLVLFTNTVSHKMATSAISEAKRNGTEVERIHSSSATALQNILEKRAACPV